MAKRTLFRTTARPMPPDRPRTLPELEAWQRAETERMVNKAAAYLEATAEQAMHKLLGTPTH